MKRGRETLTGGTGDVNPQLFVSSNLTSTTNDGFVEAAIALPINRFPTGKSKAVVIEILKVWFAYDNPDVQTNQPAGLQFQENMQLSTKEQGAINPTRPGVFAWTQRTWIGGPTLAATGATSVAVVENPVVRDLTDGAGHGFLVATDNIYFAFQTLNFAALADGWFRMLYRFKAVGLDEFVGMVSGQS